MPQRGTAWNDWSEQRAQAKRDPYPLGELGPPLVALMGYRGTYKPRDFFMPIRPQMPAEQVRPASRGRYTLTCAVCMCDFTSDNARQETCSHAHGAQLRSERRRQAKLAGIEDELNEALSSEPPPPPHNHDDAPPDTSGVQLTTDPAGAPLESQPCAAAHGDTPCEPASSAST